jgi:hypothetical protein
MVKVIIVVSAHGRWSWSVVGAHGGQSVLMVLMGFRVVMGASSRFGFAKSGAQALDQLLAFPI